MALTQGTDTYITLADADTYIATMPGDYPTVWDALADAAKEKFLTRATRYLDNAYRNTWVGDLYVSTQVLSWPRIGYDNQGRVIDGLYPDYLGYAQCEVAARMANEEELNTDQDRAGWIEKERLGPIETVWNSNAPMGTTYPEIEDLLWLYLNNTQGSTATLVRV